MEVLESNCYKRETNNSNHRAAWRQCAEDAVTLAAPVSPWPIPAPEIGQLAEQLESQLESQLGQFICGFLKPFLVCKRV